MRVLVLCIALLPLAAGCDRRVGATATDQAAEGGQTSTSNQGAVEGSSATADPDAPDADNTALNVRDRDGEAPTPLDQGQNQDDINTTVTIRRRVVDLPLSLNAHNVKIITQDGKVTLRGPVKTSEEREQIEGIAVEVAGADNVTNMLEVERN